MSLSSDRATPVALMTSRAPPAWRDSWRYFSGPPESADSWTPGLKPLCHRHRTGPRPSGLLWTLWTSDGHCRALAPPRHRRLVGVGGAEQHWLAERLAGELDRDRQAAFAEARADADRREAGDVERHGEGRLFSPFRQIGDLRRLTGLRRADDDVEVGHRSRHLLAQHAAPAR